MVDGESAQPLQLVIDESGRQAAGDQFPVLLRDRQSGLVDLRCRVDHSGPDLLEEVRDALFEQLADYPEDGVDGLLAPRLVDAAANRKQTADGVGHELRPQAVGNPEPSPELIVEQRLRAPTKQLGEQACRRPPVVLSVHAEAAEDQLGLCHPPARPAGEPRGPGRGRGDVTGNRGARRRRRPKRLRGGAHVTGIQVADDDHSHQPRIDLRGDVDHIGQGDAGQRLLGAADRPSVPARCGDHQFGEQCVGQPKRIHELLHPFGAVPPQDVVERRLGGPEVEHHPRQHVQQGREFSDRAVRHDLRPAVVTPGRDSGPESAANPRARRLGSEHCRAGGEHPFHRLWFDRRR